VAEGAADMVRQMVGDSVPLAWTGGNRTAGSATMWRGYWRRSTRPGRRRRRHLVDLGGAETNSEMALELLDEARRRKVAICNAPIVEGAVIAATEAAGGSPLEIVKRTAEELSAALGEHEVGDH